MIVTVEMPGGSLAQGDLILQIGTYATVNAGGIICGACCPLPNNRTTPGEIP